MCQKKIFFFIRVLHFEICSIKKYIFKIAILRNTFLEFLPQKCIFKVTLLKYIFKIAASKNSFSRLLPKKDIFEIAPLT